MITKRSDRDDLSVEELTPPGCARPIPVALPTRLQHLGVLLTVCAPSATVELIDYPNRGVSKYDVEDALYAARAGLRSRYSDVGLFEHVATVGEVQTWKASVR